LVINEANGPSGKPQAPTVARAQSHRSNGSKPLPQCGNHTPAAHLTQQGPPMRRVIWPAEQPEAARLLPLVRILIRLEHGLFQKFTEFFICAFGLFHRR